MALAYVAVDGPPEAMICPVVVCDQCGDLIDSEHPGIVIWPGRELLSTRVAHTHKGPCNKAYEAANPGPWSWADISTWLAQLTRNVEAPASVITEALRLRRSTG